MTPDQVKAAGAALFQAEQTRQQIPILTLQYPEMDMDDAYAIQADLCARKAAAGARVDEFAPVDADSGDRAARVAVGQSRV